MRLSISQQTKTVKISELKEIMSKRRVVELVETLWQFLEEISNKMIILSTLTPNIILRLRLENFQSCSGRTKCHFYSQNSHTKKI